MEHKHPKEALSGWVSMGWRNTSHIVLFRNTRTPLLSSTDHSEKAIIARGLFTLWIITISQCLWEQRLIELPHFGVNANRNWFIKGVHLLEEWMTWEEAKDGWRMLQKGKGLQCSFTSAVTPVQGLQCSDSSAVRAHIRDVYRVKWSWDAKAGLVGRRRVKWLQCSIKSECDRDLRDTSLGSPALVCACSRVLNLFKIKKLLYSNRNGEQSGWEAYRYGMGENINHAFGKELIFKV